MQQIQDRARELLQAKAVDCVIGYERATDGVTARPVFVYDAADAGKLIFDKYCVHNLSKYLLNKKDKKTAIVAKPCDSRSINLLINEKQLQRDKIYVIGVACDGVTQSKWGRPSDKQEMRCQLCPITTPIVSDIMIGQPKAAKPAAPEYGDVSQIEGKTVEEKAAFWAAQFDKCIRCYGCRNVCPSCYCPECFVDRVDPSWVGIRIAPTENHMWNTGRALHLAARCVGCSECERVCPANLPLMLVNRKMEKEVGEMFHFQAGMSAETIPPQGTYVKDEKLGIGE